MEKDSKKQQAQRRGEKSLVEMVQLEREVEGERERQKETQAKGERGPELDRIGELVITEAGDSPGTSASLPRAST